jgi:transcriptional regulator with XRE-family HTH domain
LTKSVEFATGRIDGYQAERNLLKRARRNAGLTQQQLADITGVPLRVIQSYEQGQRSLETAGMESVRRICRALGCRVEDIRPI